MDYQQNRGFSLSFEPRTIILVKGTFSRCDFSFRTDRMSMYAKASHKQKD
jgi:hypothetical protein